MAGDFVLNVLSLQASGESWTDFKLLDSTLGARWNPTVQLSLRIFTNASVLSYFLKSTIWYSAVKVVTTP
jgi:hypothetical protein